MKILRYIALILVAVFSMGYFPGNWQRSHSTDDTEEANLIVIARVVGLRLASENVLNEKAADQTWNHALLTREYTATLRICEVLKDTDDSRKFQKGSTIELYIGGTVGNPKDIYDPRPSEPALSMCNTQQGYDLRIDQVYVLFMIRSHLNYWGRDLRSGPHSAFWVLPGDEFCQKDLGGWDKPHKGYAEWLASIRKRIEVAKTTEPKPEDKKPAEKNGQ